MKSATFLRILIIAVSIALAGTPQLAFAQRGGHGGGGGFHSGGVGGFRGGRYFGGYGGYPFYGYGFDFGFGFGPYWGYPYYYGYAPWGYPYSYSYPYSYDYPDGSDYDRDYPDRDRSHSYRRDDRDRCDYRYEDTCQGNDNNQRPARPSSGSAADGSSPRSYVT